MLKFEAYIIINQVTQNRADGRATIIKPLNIIHVNKIEDEYRTIEMVIIFNTCKYRLVIFRKSSQKSSGVRTIDTPNANEN